MLRTSPRPLSTIRLKSSSTMYRGGSRYFARRYGALRSALKGVRDMVREHPALASVRTAPDNHEEFVVGRMGHEDGIHRAEVWIR